MSPSRLPPAPPPPPDSPHPGRPRRLDGSNPPPAPDTRRARRPFRKGLHVKSPSVPGRIPGSKRWRRTFLLGQLHGYRHPFSAAQNLQDDIGARRDARYCLLEFLDPSHPRPSEGDHNVPPAKPRRSRGTTGKDAIDQHPLLPLDAERFGQFGAQELDAAAEPPR